MEQGMLRSSQDKKKGISPDIFCKIIGQSERLWCTTIVNALSKMFALAFGHEFLEVSESFDMCLELSGLQ